MATATVSQKSTTTVSAAQIEALIARRTKRGLPTSASEERNAWRTALRALVSSSS